MLVLFVQLLYVQLLYVQLAVFLSVRLDSHFQNAILKFWWSFRVFACDIVRGPFAMA